MKRICLLIAAACLLGSACDGCTDATPVGNNDPADAGGDLDTIDTCGANCAPDDDAGDDDSGDDTGADASTCPVARTCESECCEADQLCIQSGCVTPGMDCEVNQDCADEEVCEVTLGKCIPDPGVECTYQPDFEEFNPEVSLAWRADANTPASTYDQVMMTPAVADITEDGIPDVVFSTFTGGSYNEASILRAFDGRTYDPIFDLTDAPRQVSGSASVAIGDIDGDLRNEIVAVAPPGQGLIAFDDHTTDWAVLWTTAAFPMAWDGGYLTDLDGNGTVEIVAGRRVFDGATGDLLCANPDQADAPMNSSAADLDDDGVLEVVAGGGAFRFVDNGDGTFSCPTYWTVTGGFPAVADFGNFEGGNELYGEADGKPEVVTVNTGATNQIQLFNGQTGARIWAATLPTTGHPYFSDAECQGKTGAGPPTVADFDGDGEPEIATAGACYYVVYETDGTLLWQHPSQDFSSRITGSSVFDFEGDGKAEVVYADECFVRVYDGAGNGDGTTDVLFKRSHSSGTTRELPVIVDVDRDFHAEIIMISNDYSGVGMRCSMFWPDYDALGGPERGVLIVEDPKNEWVTTRPIWNQHAYHVTNVCDGIDDSLCPGAAQNLPGVIPATQAANWKLDFLNNFRQNVQGEGLFDAPDLVVADIDHQCGDGNGITIEVTVANQGARGIVAGTNVAIFFEYQGNDELVTVLQTTVDLPPGARETLTYEWNDAPDVGVDMFAIRAVVDSDGMGTGEVNECVENNNILRFEGTCSCVEDTDCDLDEYCAEGTCVEVPD